MMPLSATHKIPVWKGLFALGAVLPSLLLFAPDGAAQTATTTAVNSQSCAATRFGSNLVCTANDFSTTLTFDQPSSNTLASCLAGQSYYIDVIGQITSSSPNRYDGGFFIGEAGNSPDIADATKTCSIGIFPTTPSPFIDLDTDSCGDFAATSTASLRINHVLVKCAPAPGTSVLALPYTLVFENQVGSTACNVNTIQPGTKSKCISSTTATVTGVIVNGYITLTKQTLPDGEPQSFSFTSSASAGTAAPSGFTLTDGASQTVQVPLPTTGSVTLTLTEAATSGWLPGTSITCTTPSGAVASYVSVNNTARTITATLNPTNGGALCTITNTKIPTVKVTKTTLGAAGGPFAFSATNLASSPSSITTTAASTATPASPAAINVSTIGTAVTLTETPASGYKLTAASCTDANSARTGNAGTIGTLSGNVLTIPSGNSIPGADFTCNFTNTKLPTLTLSSCRFPQAQRSLTRTCRSIPPASSIIH